MTSRAARYQRAAQINKKRGLLVYCWKLCAWKNIPREGLGIVAMVEALSGQRVSKDYAYLWLEQARELKMLPAGLPDAPRPPMPKMLLSERPLTQEQLNGPGFYDTDQWRALRYKALKRHGAACQACGRNWRDNRVKIHVDHIKPRSRYPQLALDIENLQILCEDCNLGKSNSDATDWRPTEGQG